MGVGQGNEKVLVR